jgi:hypothetical protein
VTSSVWPSGAARLTPVAPIVPVAPGLFSTTNGCPNFSCSLGAIARASVSVDPPGGNGTTIVTGLVGQASAWVESASDIASAAKMRFIMVSLR